MFKRSIFTLILLLCAFVVTSFAVEVTILGPNEYLRTKGKPNQFSNTFPGRSGAGKLIIYNGDESGKHRISSATIKLNGEVVVKPNSFSQKVGQIEISVNLLEENTLDVSLASKPGSFITVKAIQDVEAEAAAVIGPEGGIVEVTDPESELYGVKLTIPQNAINSSKVITISLTDKEFGYNKDKIELFNVTPPIQILPENLFSESDKFQIQIPYSDINNDGFIDETSFLEDNINIYCLIDNGNTLVRHENYRVDNEYNRINIFTNHFSIWLPWYWRWMKDTTVYYYIESLPNDEFGYYSEESFVTEVEAAFLSWGDALNQAINFQRLSLATESVDIYIKKEDFCSYFSDPRLLCGSDGASGISLVSPFYMTIWFNTNYDNQYKKRLWITNDYCSFPPEQNNIPNPPPSPYNAWAFSPFLRIALHEIGHSIGLPEYTTDETPDYNICSGYTTCNDTCVSGEKAIMKYDQHYPPYPFVELSPFDFVEAEKHYDLVPLSDFDGDGITGDLDCEDYDADIYPGAIELCDGKDNDCDGDVDESCSTPDPGELVAYYPLDNDAFDDSGNGYDGNSTDVTYVEGAASFNGTTSYIEVPQNTAFDLQTYTVSAWVKPDWSAFDTTNCIIGHGESSSDIMQYSLITFLDDSNNGNFRAWYESSSDSDYRVTYTLDQTEEKWYFVAVSRDEDGNYKLFLGDEDGSFMEADSLSNTPNPPSILHPLQIGVRTRDGNRLEDYFNGMIDEVRIYNYAMDQGEVEDIYDLGR